MRYYLFEDLNRTDALALDASLQLLRGAGVDVHLASMLVDPRAEVSHIQIVAYCNDARLVDLVSQAGGRDVTTEVSL